MPLETNSEFSLLNAIKRNELVLHYQPIVNLQSAGKEVCGFEALVRWQHPEKGLLYPSDFLPQTRSMKASDLIWQYPLFEWVFNKCCNSLDYFKSSEYLAVNVAPTQLGEDHFLALVKKNTARYELKSRIQFEITESEISSKDLSLLKSVLLPLSEISKFALDDVGTGSSSLWRLRELSGIISLLKIDRSFIPKNLQDTQSIAVNRCFADLARAFNLKTVAEGIETKEQSDICQIVGIDFGQGFYYKRPMPLESLRKNPYE
jgi:diguanylate cyclase